MQKKQEPETLSLGNLPHHTGYALRRAQLAVFEDVIKALASVDLRPAQYSVLLLIAENPNCKQNQIADALGIQRPNFVAMVDALEKRKLARRAASAHDRRSRTLVLTDEGEALLQKASDHLSMQEKRLTAKLGEKPKGQLLELLALLAP